MGGIRAHFVFVEVGSSDDCADKSDCYSEQDPECLCADLPYEAVMAVIGCEPADADDGVPAEFALDYCGVLVYVCWGRGRGAGLTGWESDGEVEEEGAGYVVFLEGEAVEGVDEDELEVEGDAEDEPVCDAWGGGGC